MRYSIHKSFKKRKDIVARLPKPGGDLGSWGDILNDFLTQAHNTDGTIKKNVISEATLSQVVRDKLNTTAGQQGATGPGVPTGGTAGQILSKKSGASFDTEWVTATSTIIGDSSVTTAKIADGTVTEAKLSSEAQAKLNGVNAPDQSLTKDKLALALGVVFDISDDQPANPLYTTANGTNVPVLWLQPSSLARFVPVIPATPTWDPYQYTVLVPDLVGIQYSVVSTGQIIPPAVATKVVSSTPTTVTIAATAKPGYQLPNAFSWSYSAYDMSNITLLTSDTFDSPTRQTLTSYGSTNTALGGSPILWTGDTDAFTVMNNTLTLTKTGSSSYSQQGVTLKTNAENMRVEFDLTLPSTGLPQGRGVGFSLVFINGQSNRYIYFSGGIGTIINGDMVGILPSPNGHYIVDYVNSTLTIKNPAGDTNTVITEKVSTPINTIGFTRISMASPDFEPTIENIKVSKIGF